MQGATIHPHDETNSISSDDTENDSRCSLTNLLRTRRHGKLFFISMMIIIFICGITIPLAIMLSSPNDDERLPTATANTNFYSTTNTTIFTLSTTSLNESMNTTLTSSNN